MINKTRVPASSLLYDPGQSSAAMLKWLGTTVKDSLAVWDIPSLDREVNSLQPGEVTGIIARPGHGKTAVATYFAKNMAYKLAGQADKRAVIYVAYDEAIEHIEALFHAGRNTFSITDLMRGEVPIETVEQSVLKRHQLPIWLMGESITDWRGVVRMTIDNVYEGLRSMERDYGHKPALVVIDYIQIVPTERGADRAKQVTEAVVESKALARAIKAPIIICVQASRRVDGTDYRLPEAQDCQWASSIEQVATKLISLWRPYLTHRDVKQIKVEGNTFDNTYDLLVAALVKQKGGSAGKKFALRLSPQYVQLEDWQRSEPPELRTIDEETGEVTEGAVLE